ncbi:MAG: DeoR/GlpR family DNA-binding transcription regulator [Bacillota bacterium]
MRRLFTEERLSKIVELLAGDRRVAVSELSRLLDVSESTIRRDLNLLEKQGLIKRTHGGAVPATSTAFEPSFFQKEIEFIEEKKSIGRKAAEMIEEGETVILDSGTTTLQIAKCCASKRNLTVVTNSIHVALELSGAEYVEVVVVGGSLRKKTLALVGPVTEDGLRGLYADKVFLGVNGISAGRGLSTPNIVEARAKRAMLCAAREAIVVADHSKMGREAFASIAPLDRVQALITDRGISDSDRRMIEEKGVRVIVAD